MSDLRQKILNFPDIKKETLHVEEWDVDVEVWGLTSAERAKCVEAATIVVDEEKGTTEVSDTGILIPLVIAGAHDPETKALIFGEADRDALGGKNAKAVQRIAQAVLRLSGMSQTEQEKIKGN